MTATTHPTSSSTDPSPADSAPTGVVSESEAALSGLAAWLMTTDHKRIGRMYIGASLLAALAAVTLGVLLGVERTDGEEILLDSSSIGQLFSAFDVALVFGAGFPLLLGIAIAAVPLQVGARSLAFPRLAMAGFWTWAIGLTLVIIAYANDGGPGGADADMVTLFVVALGLAALGLAGAAVAVATTVLTSRAPGMTLGGVPVFSWSALVGSVALLLSLPVLIGVLAYLYVDVTYGDGSFSGATGIETWTSFAFSQPATVVLAIPAIGIAAELFPVTFGNRLPQRGIVYAGLGLVGIAALAAVTQQSSRPGDLASYTLILDDAETAFESLIPYGLLVGLPVLGVLVVMAGSAASALGGRPRVNGPFAFGFLGVGVILAGMIGGGLYLIEELDAVGTVLNEGALVAVVYGSVLCALGGVAYWAPKWWGRTMPDGPVLGLALLGALGAALASLPYYVAGFAGQDAASPVYSYDGPAELWNVLVLIGHGVMGLTVVAFGALALRAFTGRGEPAGDDPWGGHTLEWATSSPAPAENFAGIPIVRSPEPMLDLQATPEDGSEDV